MLSCSGALRHPAPTPFALMGSPLRCALLRAAVVDERRAGAAGVCGSNFLLQVEAHHLILKDRQFGPEKGRAAVRKGAARQLVLSGDLRGP
jgi:hypothetical protein